MAERRPLVIKDGLVQEIPAGDTLPAGLATSAFLGLSDTPATYTGAELQAVRVNAAGDALEFYTPAGGGGSSTFLGLSDTPANFTGQAGNAVIVNQTEDGLEFGLAPGGGGVQSNVPGREVTVVPYNTTGGTQIDIDLSDCDEALVMVRELSLSVSGRARWRMLAGATEENTAVYSHTYLTSTGNSMAANVTEVFFGGTDVTGEARGTLKIQGHNLAAQTHVEDNSFSGTLVVTREAWVNTTDVYDGIRFYAPSGTFDAVDIEVHKIKYNAVVLDAPTSTRGKMGAVSLSTGDTITKAVENILQFDTIDTPASFLALNSATGEMTISEPGLYDFNVNFHTTAGNSGDTTIELYLKVNGVEVGRRIVHYHTFSWAMNTNGILSAQLEAGDVVEVAMFYDGAAAASVTTVVSENWCQIKQVNSLGSTVTSSSVLEVTEQEFDLNGMLDAGNEIDIAFDSAHMVEIDILEGAAGAGEVVIGRVGDGTTFDSGASDYRREESFNGGASNVATVNWMRLSGGSGTARINGFSRIIDMDHADRRTKVTGIYHASGNIGYANFYRDAQQQDTHLRISSLNGNAFTSGKLIVRWYKKINVSGAAQRPAAITASQDLTPDMFAGNVIQKVDTTAGDVTLTIPTTTLGDQPCVFKKKGTNALIFATAGPTINSVSSALRVVNEHGVCTLDPETDGSFDLFGDITV